MKRFECGFEDAITVSGLRLQVGDICFLELNNSHSQGK